MSFTTMPHCDAHERAPAHIQAAYKRLQRPSRTQTDEEEDILDFAKSIPAGARIYRTLTADELNTCFAKFDESTDLSSASLEDVNIYELASMPGAV